MCSQLMVEHMEQYKTFHAFSWHFWFDALPFFPWNCFQAVTFWSNPWWCLNPVEFEVGEGWSRRWWWLFGLLTLTSGTSCSALAQDVCVRVGILGQAVRGSSHRYVSLLWSLPALICRVWAIDASCHVRGWRLAPLLGQLEKESNRHFSYGSVRGARTILSFYLPIKLTKPNILLKVMCLLSSCTDHVLHFEHS